MEKKRVLKKTTTKFIGCDIGKKGAIAIINSQRKILLLEDYPENEIKLAKLIIDFINPRDFYFAGIEKATAMPKQGSVSMFNFGDCFGQWKGIFSAVQAFGYNQFTWEIIDSKIWKKELKIKNRNKKKETLTAYKKRTTKIASQLFPTAELYGSKGGAKDGRADALLIAECLRRRNVK